MDDSEKESLTLYRLIKQYWFWIIVVLLILIKQRLVTMLPLYPIYSNGGYDDLLMVQIADDLLHFSWPTEPVRLTKGIGFPLFLVLGILSGFGYAALTTLFHSGASLLMVFAVSPLIKHKWMMLIFFSLLLFLPVTYSIDCFQRVYRNSITIWQVLLVLSSLSGMLFRLNKTPKVLLVWSLPGIIGLSWLFHTREDALWIVPFAAGMLIMSCFFLLFIVSWKNREYWIKGSILLLPLIFLLITVEIISAMNYLHNGFWGTTIFTAGSFPRMVRSVYRIRWPDSEQLPPRLAVSRRQMYSLYQFSPTMAAKQKHIERQLDQWSTGSPPPNPGKEVENGWIFWAMLYWADERQACKAILFYDAVARELNSAVDQGKLKTRPTMPSALMAPWKPSAFPSFIKAFRKSWNRILKNQKLHIANAASSDVLQGIRYLEDFTGTKFPHTSDFSCNIKYYQAKVVKILNVFIFIYQKMSVVINILGWAGFLVILISAVYSRNIQLFQTVVFLLGLFLSCTLLVIGVAYTHATGFDAVHPCYLAGGYPIILVFDLVALFSAWNVLADLYSRLRYHHKRMSNGQLSL